jgi:D-sedoheptulose 7-phosphate isomerase
MERSLSATSNEILRQNVRDSLQEGAALRLSLIEHCSDVVIKAAECIFDSVQRGGKLLVFGNGGSAADAQHLAGEFVGRFTKDRPPLPAIALTTDTSAMTAIGNDYGFDHVFARQVTAMGVKPDVVVAISTSGRSPNVLNGVKAASDKDLTTIAFSGGDGGPLAKMADISIIVPSVSTPRIQECHITLVHIMCEVLETLLDNRTSA